MERNKYEGAENAEGGNAKELASLSYLWVFGPILLIAKRANPFIQHHARRGTVLFFLSLVLWPYAPLRYGEFAVLALAIFGFIQASMGNENRTPVLSEIADGTLSRKDVGAYMERAKQAVTRTGQEPGVLVQGAQVPAQSAPEVPVSPVGTLELEDRKLSALIHRVNEDEVAIHRLESEVKRLQAELDLKGK